MGKSINGTDSQICTCVPFLILTTQSNGMYYFTVLQFDTLSVRGSHYKAPCWAMIVAVWVIHCSCVARRTRLLRPFMSRRFRKNVRRLPWRRWGRNGPRSGVDQQSRTAERERKRDCRVDQEWPRQYARILPFAYGADSGVGPLYTLHECGRLEMRPAGDVAAGAEIFMGVAAASRVTRRRDAVAPTVPIYPVSGGRPRYRNSNSRCANRTRTLRQAIR